MVVVTRLDRLARSTGNVLGIAEAIRAKEAGLLSLAELRADTTSPAGRMVLTVFAGIAEFERELIRQRTEEGRQKAWRDLRAATQAEARSAGARHAAPAGRPLRERGRAHLQRPPAIIYRCIERPGLRACPEAL